MGGWVSIHTATYPNKLGPQPFNTNEIIKRSLLVNPATKTTTINSVSFHTSGYMENCDFCPVQMVVICLDPVFVLRTITDTPIDTLRLNRKYFIDSISQVLPRKQGTISEPVGTCHIGS